MALVGWSLLFIIPGFLFGDRSETWFRDASIWARYMLGFPGGMLAAFGLRYQAQRQIKPLNLDRPWCLRNFCRFNSVSRRVLPCQLAERFSLNHLVGYSSTRAAIPGGPCDSAGIHPRDGCL